MAQPRIPVKSKPGLYKRGDSYCFRVQVDGKRSWITIPGGDIGVQAAGQFMNRYLGKTQIVAPTSETVIGYFKEWLPTRRLKPGSVRNYLNHMENLKRLHHRKLAEIKPTDIRILIKELEGKGLAPATIAATLVPLSAMYETLVSDGKVEWNPVQRLERKTLPPVEKRDYPILTGEEASALFAAAENRTLAVHVALALMAGLRLSESLGLQWEDVKWEGTAKMRKPHLHVWRQLEPSYTKGGKAQLVVGLKGEKGLAKEKRVELSPALLKLLAQHSLATGGEGFVICTERQPRRPGVHQPVGSPQSHTNMRKRFRALVAEVFGSPEDEAPATQDELALRGLRYHDLRHNFATALIAMGEDVAFVQHQLGHASPITTLSTYTHSFRERDSKGEAGAAIEKAFGAALG